MVAVYPGAVYSVPSFGTNMSDVQTHTTWRNNMVDEMRAVQLELGTTPSGAFSTVAAAIAQTVGVIQAKSFTPVGNTDCNASGSYADWFSFGNITVPTWAASAYVNVDLMRSFLVAANTNVFLIRFAIGTAVSGGAYLAYDATMTSAAVAGERGSTQLVTAPPSGAQAFKVQTLRSSGTSVARMDASSLAAGLVIFLP